MITLTIDIETKSECDLKKHGAWVYSCHPTTQIWCIALKVNSEKTKLFISDWAYKQGFTFSGTYSFIAFEQSIIEIMKKKDVRIIAHNIFFEYAILNNVFLPERMKWAKRKKDFEKLFSNPDNYFCTMSFGSYFNYSRSLIDMTRETGLQKQKFGQGLALIKKLSIPRKYRKSYVWDEPKQTDVKRFFTYCIRDVNATYDLYNKLVELKEKIKMPEVFFELMQTHHNMNIKGIPVNKLKIDLLIEGATKITKKLEKAVKDIYPDLNLRSPKQLIDKLKSFKFSIENAQSKTLLKLLFDNEIEIKNIEEVYKKKPSITIKDKKRLACLEKVNQIIFLRLELSKTSIKKLHKAQDQICSDNTLKDQYKLFSARTGRFAGQGVQPQNMIKQLNKSSNFYPIDKELNSIIRAGSRNALFIADYSSIEARLLGWLANEPKYKNAYIKGEDLYKKSAGYTFKRAVNEVTDEERFIGKQQILSCGYGCGVDKFTEATNTRLLLMKKPLLDIQKARFIVSKYRETFKSIPALWYDVGDTAIRVIRSGTPLDLFSPVIMESIRVKFSYVKEKKLFYITLPSGRIMFYYDTYLSKDKEGRTVIVSNGVKLWGGHIVENIVQAMSFDILAYTMVNVSKNKKLNGRMIMTTHDEIVFLSEIENLSERKKVYKTFIETMKMCPKWLWNDFLLEVEGCISPYYRKP